MMKEWFAKMTGTKWKGKGEIWLDPEGNSAEAYDCELIIQGDEIKYSWTYENEVNHGSFTFHEAGATWVDSWHQPNAVSCSNVQEAWVIFAVSHKN